MYVFDTDILSLGMKDRLAPSVVLRLAGVPEERAGTTSITLGELYYGALRSAAAQRYLKAIHEATHRLRRLNFDEQAARDYAELRTYLENKGQRLDDADLRIAAICRSQDAILVSGNESHFGRVPGLRYENWLAP